MQQEKNKNNKILLNELDLLRFLFRDLFPIINRSNKKINNDFKINSSNNKNNKYYNKKINDISIDDIVKIKKTLAKNSFNNKTKININGNTDNNKKLNKTNDFENNVIKNDATNNLFFYNAKIKNLLQNNTLSYGISISYENNASEEKLDIEISDNKTYNYKLSIVNKRENNDYSIKIVYEYKNNEETLNISYGYNIGYLQKHIDSKQDFTDRVPLKFLNILPETMMGGVLGFTYIGDPSMGRRADLTGKTARMVDIHESIHTPDEYETRVLTEWMMNSQRTRYIFIKDYSLLSENKGSNKGRYAY